MNIGYASLTIGVEDANFRTCRMKDASNKNLREIISHNLASLDRIIDYNIKNDISLFRISSDIIPFGSSPVNELAWWDIFADELKSIGDKAKEFGMRLSMHPGQYTVLNSLDEDVVARAVDDLAYHARFLDALGLDSTSKMILHIGGVYGNKEAALSRFKNNYLKLDEAIKARLVIENDDKSYNIAEVLELGYELDIPVVYDNLHNEILGFDPSKSDSYWIKKAKETWKSKDGKQKIHYSQQALGKRTGSHSDTIDLKKFKNFVDNLDLDYEIDIMLEVKDKNLSAIKVKNLLETYRIQSLELEWSRYKYNILEHSPANYMKIRQLLKDKSTYPVLEFYEIIDRSLAEDIEIKNGINSAQHVWGYFKDIASEKEKKRFLSYLASYERGTYSIKAIKNLLYKMAEKYEEDYLLSSFYFYF